MKLIINEATEKKEREREIEEERGKCKIAWLIKFLLAAAETSVLKHVFKLISVRFLCEASILFSSLAFSEKYYVLRIRPRVAIKTATLQRRD